VKIDETIRSTFARQRAVADRLKATVDAELIGAKHRSWHYESRAKEEESFALKVESGRTSTPDAIEDLFACVLVVPNFSDVKPAEDLILGMYDFDHKRPESATETRKSPSDFRFDDLRLYVRYRDQGYGPPSGLGGQLFEIQIRTFLQHAWTVATHDVIYKADDVSWRRERVASHAKAALEQAEVTIESMAALELSKALPETNERFELLNDIIRVLKEHWTADELPHDIKRLAEGIHDLLWNLRLNDSATFTALLESGRARYSGRHNADWSPYRAVLQYVAEQHGPTLKRLLTNEKSRATVFMYPAVLALIGLEASRAVRGAVLG
jgi:ppGpp synthetase/RelA/SpoT-type nucleotidyltranferase